jgi:hypothetical protein
MRDNSWNVNFFETDARTAIGAKEGWLERRRKECESFKSFLDSQLNLRLSKNDTYCSLSEFVQTGDKAKLIKLTSYMKTYPTNLAQHFYNLPKKQYEEANRLFTELLDSCSNNENSKTPAFNP